MSERMKLSDKILILLTALREVISFWLDDPYCQAGSCKDCVARNLREALLLLLVKNRGPGRTQE